MKPQRQNEAILRTLGWEDLAPGEPRPVNWRFSVRPPIFGKGIGGVIASDPVWPSCDYVGDLNAMHEVEKTLSAEQCYHYSTHLGQILGPWEPHTKKAATWPFHATAAQRAEAFLRTLGLWEEEEKS